MSTRSVSTHLSISSDHTTDVRCSRNVWLYSLYTSLFLVWPLPLLAHRLNSRQSLRSRTEISQIRVSQDYTTTFNTQIGRELPRSPSSKGSLRLSGLAYQLGNLSRAAVSPMYCFSVLNISFMVLERICTPQGRQLGRQQQICGGGQVPSPLPFRDFRRK